MIVNKFAIIVVLMLTLSYAQSSKKSEPRSFNDTVITNKLVKYTGDSAVRYFDELGEFYQISGEFLDLPRIQASTSGMSLRIWLWSDSGVNYVANLQKNDTSYSGNIVVLHTPDPRTGEFFVKYKIINIKPVSGWAALLPQLKVFQEVVSANRKTDGIMVLQGMRDVYVEIKEYLLKL
ncbi:MAG: hypothetical protein EOP48_26390 [Sphingobacteriales bacterium]|nr:MAG: hypothetical protein EOP48_26390 [Sphingobacteriales bacterium]